MLDSLANEREQHLRLLQEKERREAKRSILALGQRLTGFDPVLHHTFMAGALDRWLDLNSGVDRLALFMPPRHGKSIYASEITPVALFGRHPKARVMHVSHGMRLATKFGRRIRNHIAGPVNPWAPEGLSIVGDQGAKHEWGTTWGGEYNAFGVGGHPSGTAADWLIVDDPISGFEEAGSEPQRETAWELFSADVFTRLEGPQKQLWVMTRWHQDDPIGRILPADFCGRSGVYPDRDSGKPWFVLSMPAVSEHDNDPCGRKPGEWLWPDRHGPGSEAEAQRKRAESSRSMIAKRVWSSLYQQRPAPEEGLFFDKDDLRYYPAHMARDRAWLRTLKIYGASDYAVATPAGKTDPDYTVHGVFGVDEDWNVYVLDWVRMRKNSAAWVEAWLSLVQRWRPIRWADEAGQIEKAIGPFRMARQREAMKEGRNCMTVTEPFTSSTSKEARAQSIAAVIAMHRFYLPTGEPWVPAFEQEMASFPTGAHDDQVDVCSLFGRLLDTLITGQREKQEEKRDRNTFKEAFRYGLDDDEWNPA